MGLHGAGEHLRNGLISILRKPNRLSQSHSGHGDAAAPDFKRHLEPARGFETSRSAFPHKIYVRSPNLWALWGFPR